MKRRNLTTVLVLMVFSLILSSCGSKVEKVKKTHWRGDESITIGDALDKYKYFESPKWENTKEENGRQFVDFTATISPAFFNGSVEGKATAFLKELPDFDKTMDNTEAMSIVYTAIIQGSNQAAPHLAYMAGKEMKKYIAANERLKFSIRFKINEGKDKNPNIDSYSIVDLKTNKEMIKLTSIDDVLGNIFKEKPMFGEEIDAYWAVGSKAVMEKGAKAIGVLR